MHTACGDFCNEMSRALACVLRPQGHTDRVSGIAMSPKTDEFLSASDDKTVRFWVSRSPTAAPPTARPQTAKDTSHEAARSVRDACA